MPDEEIIEEEQQEEEPLVIETKGKWQPFEAMVGQTHETGHTYKIDVQGVCEFAISKEKPDSGMRASEITYTKKENTRLWIKTGG